jgi:SAM-dependent methyltransferase
VIDTFANVGSRFRPSSLDVVICNGVIGWGLNDADEINESAKQCFECLRPGGIFIIGWNDIAPWRPVPLHELDAIRKFAPLTLAPFPGPVYPTLGKLRHVFNFYTRP